ncbi:hypothetical protein EDB81DRAFT_905831 [Dactylonectria macrodidyma]|uniref:2EXR domain-containing protein n=1 Tax=Dactylonectria macrodidyma TaxID=307937 RepID=A0A9P9E2C2_9HYPO|nr:hypothetical protein EDB81DRAFT_905831 [Dactylonectria macrodidyma]
MAYQWSSNPQVLHHAPQFKNLPTELRLRIWQCALANETAGRTIHVAALPRFVKTWHSCVSNGDGFCGQQDQCPKYRSSNQTSAKLCVSMRDGYFITSLGTEHPEEPAASARFQAISLVCREAREVVLARYPKFLRVNRRHWVHDQDDYCLVRCNPALDILLISDIGDPIQRQGGRNPDPRQAQLQYFPSGDRYFPNDAARFAEFREMVSEFRHVAFSYTGKKAPSHKEQRPGSGSTRFYMDMSDFSIVSLWSMTPVHRNEDLCSLLMFFTSLKHIYAWPDPNCFPEAQKNPVIANSVEDLKTMPAGLDVGSVVNSRDIIDKGSITSPNYIMQQIQKDSREVLRCYHARVPNQNDHYTDRKGRWVAKPSLSQEIGLGCYVSASWMKLASLGKHYFNQKPGSTRSIDVLALSSATARLGPSPHVSVNFESIFHYGPKTDSSWHASLAPALGATP